MFTIEKNLNDLNVSILNGIFAWGKKPLDCYENTIYYDKILLLVEKNNLTEILKKCNLYNEYYKKEILFVEYEIIKNLNWIQHYAVVATDIIDDIGIRKIKITTEDKKLYAKLLLIT